MLKAVLFDLDGTLLPMQELDFIKKYAELLDIKMAKIGLDGTKLGRLIWESMHRIEKNDGSKTNNDVFNETFIDFYGEEASKYKSLLLDYYINEFSGTKMVCTENPLARTIIDFVNNNNLLCILATSPVYPSVATINRMSFIGLKESDFSLFTHHENCRYGKTNPNYYLDILNKFNLKPNEVLLFGNNTFEDGETSLKCGIKTYLIEGCIIYDKRSSNNFETIKMQDVIPTIKKHLDNE